MIDQMIRAMSMFVFNSGNTPAGISFADTCLPTDFKSVLLDVYKSCAYVTGRTRTRTNMLCIADV